MSSLEFVLSLLIALMTFVAFALTLTTILLGNDKTKMAAVELFKAFVNRPTNRSAKLHNAQENEKSTPVRVKQNGKAEV